MRVTHPTISSNSSLVWPQVITVHTAICQLTLLLAARLQLFWVTTNTWMRLVAGHAYLWLQVTRLSLAILWVGAMVMVCSVGSRFLVLCLRVWCTTICQRPIVWWISTTNAKSLSILLRLSILGSAIKNCHMVQSVVVSTMYIKSNCSQITNLTRILVTYIVLSLKV